MRRTMLFVFVIAMVATGCMTQPGGGGGGGSGPAPKQVVAISTDSVDTCAVIAGGTVQCWGLYSRVTNGWAEANTPAPVPGLTDAVSVRAGGGRSCAVKGNGTVACWGPNFLLGVNPPNGFTSTPVVVPGLTNVVELEVGSYFACARRSSGDVWCWGAANDVGQLGNGTTDVPVSPIQPAPVVGLTDATAIASGSNRTCAVRATGAVVCWGMDEGGLGGPWSEYSATPVTVVGLSEAVDVSTARSSSAIRTDGTAACWGIFDNEALQNVPGLTGAVALGSDGSDCVLHSDGTATCGLRRAVDQGTPLTSWPGLDDGIALTGHQDDLYPGCALHVDASVSCFGLNAAGTLADGAPDFATTPSPSLAGGGVSLGGGHACTVGFNTLCWGRDDAGQLGFGQSPSPGLPPQSWSPSFQSPLPFEQPEPAVEVSSGDRHSCARMPAGTVYCWGLNSSGQLGVGNTAPLATPTAVVGLTGVSKIVAGDDHTCAVKADTTVWCWGLNASGQLGNGSTVSSSVPTQVSGLAGATTIAAGDDHTCVIRTDAKVLCWGANDRGQLGTSNFVSSSVPVFPDVSGPFGNPVKLAAGGAHTCLVTTGGAISCAGDNTSGQLGNGSFGGRSTVFSFVSLGSGVSATDVAAGGAHTCAATSTGGVMCWGANGRGQLGTGTTAPAANPVAVAITGVTSLDADENSTCATTSATTSKCWGDDTWGQLQQIRLNQTSKPVVWG